MQDELLDEIAMKARAQNAVSLDSLFRSEDPKDRGSVQLPTFYITLQRAYQLKEIDAKVLAMRYLESGGGHSISASAVGGINYKAFLQELKKRIDSASLSQAPGGKPGATNLFGPGLHNQDPHSEIALRLVQVLRKISDEVARSKVSLVNLLSKHEG